MVEGVPARGPRTRPEVTRDLAARRLEVDGNRLTLFPDGPERLASLIALIEGAEQSVRLLYYTFAADSSGEQVKAAAVRAAQRGLPVSLLIDGFGSTGTPDEFFADFVEIPRLIGDGNVAQVADAHVAVPRAIGYTRLRSDR